MDRPRFKWYDLWIGAFYDTKKALLYVCLLPCLPFTVKKSALPQLGLLLLGVGLIASGIVAARRERLHG